MKRLGNKLAHTLAKYAKRIDSFVIWTEENPSIIESIVVKKFRPRSIELTSYKPKLLIRLIINKHN